MKESDVDDVIQMCRWTAIEGTERVDREVVLPDMLVEILHHSLLRGGNPAVFINEKTYAAEKKKNPDTNWIANQTLIIEKNVFKEEATSFEDLLAVSIIIHEMGHAYNIAAGIPNSEANAYLFELYVLQKIYNKEIPCEITKDCSKNDYINYFRRRTGEYNRDLLIAGRGEPNQNKKQAVELLTKYKDWLKEEFNLGDVEKIPLGKHFITNVPSLSPMSENNHQEPEGQPPIPPPPPKVK